jgi:DNA polymerase III subunit gamma/tau
LGMFSLDSLNQVTQALSEQDSRRMLDIVMELERNGQNLQHFCRELARYFRNLLVAKVAGINTKLIAASLPEQERLAEIAAGFSEDDLTRYLQLTLDTFKELQFSLQPRLHLEMGLLRLVHAGRLQSIEEALSNLGTGGGPATSPLKKAAPPPAKPPVLGDWKQRLHSAFTELGLPFTADAIEHSEVKESAGELQFITPKEFSLAMNQKEIQMALQKVGAAGMRIKVLVGEPQIVSETPTLGKRPDEDEVARRALSHPEVRRFQELFPDAQVRAVRNLKE